MKEIILAVDAMGGDHGPTITVPAVFKVLAKHQHLTIVLVGREDVLRPLIAKQNAPELAARLTVQHASEEVEMDEAPARALHNKKDSSMRVAINLVKEGRAQACVSAGNTGALVAISKFVLKTLPGIDRPAISTHFPTMKPGKNTNVLDLGANIEAHEDYLVQSAIIGTLLASEIDGIANPRVALLNIGSEEIKGSPTIKKAAQVLAQHPLVNYVGFVEGNDIFRGNVDVIVCDGFTGNVMLKTIEGAFKFVKFYAKKHIFRSWWTKLLTLFALPLFQGLKRDIDPDECNGASLVGLRGVVVKSHGGANVTAFVSALEKAIIAAEKNVPQKISDELAKNIKN